jgi:hypothetical protein
VSPTQNNGMTTEQALGYPSELLAVWDLSAHEESLHVYRVDGGRLERLSIEEMSKGRRAELTFDLRGRGVRQGASDMPGPFVWSTDKGFTVWSLLAPYGVVAEGKDENLTTRDGARIRRADVASVLSFFDAASPGHRGVRVITKSGTVITIAEERSKAAELDPTYGIDHVMIEGAWATFLGRDLAGWLGVPHTDELP